jgi:hypothetical protein
MTTAIFGIENSGLNLVVNLLVLMLVVVWLALIVYTYLDAKRRVRDPFLVGCATVAAFIPYLGTAVYAILRPPEFLEDAHERELEIKAAELRVRQLTELSCPNCEHPIEKSYLRCPECSKRLKDPCPSCGKPVDPRWSLCPYCETALAQRDVPPESRRRRTRPKREEEGGPPPERRKKAAPPPREEPAADASQEAQKPKRPQRSPTREPDPDPRQA